MADAAPYVQILSKFPVFDDPIRVLKSLSAARIGWAGRQQMGPALSARSRSIITVSASLRMSAAHYRIDTPPSSITCRAHIGATPTGPSSAAQLIETSRKRTVSAGGMSDGGA